VEPAQHRVHPLDPGQPLGGPDDVDDPGVPAAGEDDVEFEPGRKATLRFADGLT
jgi:hypothetical protein